MENNLQEIREKHPEVPLGKGKDLRGQKFGRLTPLYRFVNYFDNIEEVLVKRFNDYSERK